MNELANNKHTIDSTAGEHVHNFADSTDSFEHKIKPHLIYEPHEHHMDEGKRPPVREPESKKTKRKAIPGRTGPLKQKGNKTKVDGLQETPTEEPLMAPPGRRSPSPEFGQKLEEPSTVVERSPSPTYAKSPSLIPQNPNANGSGEQVSRSRQTGDRLRSNFFKSQENVVSVSLGGDSNEYGDATVNVHLPQPKPVTGTVHVKTIGDDLSCRQEHGEALSYFVLEEGGWGWVVCAASFCANFIVFGLMSSFRELDYRIINKSYVGGSDDTKWMGLLQWASMLLFAPAAVVSEEVVGLQATTFLGALAGSTALLASSFGPSVNFLFFTYCFLAGAAYAFIYMPSLIILGHYFDSMLGLVAGFVQVGTAMGVASMPLLVEILVGRLGVRNALRIASAFVATLVLCALVWRPTYQRDVTAQARSVGRLARVGRFFNYSIWTNGEYTLWSAAMVLSAIGRLVPVMYMVPFAEQQQLGSNSETLVFNFWAASGLMGFVAGALGDLSAVSRVTLQQISLVVWAICLGMMSFAHDYAGLSCVVVLLGLCDGATMSVVVPVVFDLLGPAGASAGLGSVLGLAAPMCLIGPMLTDALQNEYFTYGLPFFVCATPNILSASFLSFVSDQRSYSRALSRTSRTESGIVAIDHPTGKGNPGRMSRCTRPKGDVQVGDMESPTGRVSRPPLELRPSDLLSVKSVLTTDDSNAGTSDQRIAIGDRTIESRA